MEKIYTFDESARDYIKKSLSDFMGMTTEQFMVFCSLMESTQSVICGAFILHSLSEFEDYHPETIHLHCSYNGALEINNFLKDEKLVKIEQQNVHITETTNIPSDSEAFFFKNRIKARLHYFISHDHPQVYPKLKIYIVENSENILETVKNFDLSLTQIWFDGNNLNATYPQTDIEKKSGYINSEYTDLILHFNPILLERINNYKKRGFVISYDIPSTTVTIMDEDLYVIPDDLIVNFLYRNLIIKMVNNFIDYKDILGQADFYLTYFWLEDYLKEDPLKLLLNLLKKLEMKKCLLPSWIQYTYSEQNKVRKREFKPYKPPTEDEQNKTEIVKMLLFDVCELSKFIISSIKKFKLYKSRAFQIVSIKYELDLEGISAISKKHNRDKKIYESYKYKKNQIQVYEKAKMLCLKKDEEIRFQKVAKDIRKQNNTREIEWLNIVDPIVTDPVRFKEKELVSYHSQPPGINIEDGKEVFTKRLGFSNLPIKSQNIFLKENL